MTIYAVQLSEDKVARLVEAKSMAAARNHILKPLIVSITAVDAKAALDLLAAGAKHEVATEKE